MFGLAMKDVVIMGFGLLSLAVWLLVYIMGLKHNQMFEILDGKEYPLKEIYGMGYAILEMIKYKFKGKQDRRLRQELDVICGGKYTEYYLRVVRSQQITVSMTVFPLAFVFYGLSGELAALLIVVMFAGVAFYYFGTLTTKKITERSRVLIHDFSDVVSKLALLTNAGMILREAWNEVAYAGDSTIYKEMQTSVDEMNNGVADVDALFNFGARCMMPEIKKFVSTLIQGITKGNRELALMLQAQSKEVWAMKKQYVRREGEKAADKLLLPLCVMFIGILIIIIVPIFANLGM